MKVKVKGRKYKINIKNVCIALAVIGVILGGLAYFFRNPFVETYTLEAGHELKVEDLLVDDVKASFKTEVTEELTKTLGEHTLVMNAKGLSYKVLLTIVDTTAPTGKPVSGITLWSDETFDPNQFVKDIVDATKVTVSFAEEIDKTKAGEKKVKVKLVDEGGNETIVETKMKLKVDTTAPVIGLPAMITAKLGESISYRSNVYIVDDRDGEITDFKVDNSKVDSSKTGIYTVTYTAVDKSGNKTTKSTKLNIVKYNEASLKKEADQYAKQILSTLITDGMTKNQKIKVIFDYVQSVYKYSAGHQGTVDDYTVDALAGFKTGKGDCYIANAMARYLLEKEGIKTKGVLLKGTDMNHLMFMTNGGDGWYYYNAYTRANLKIVFRWTGAQVLNKFKEEGITKLPSDLPKTPSK